MAGSYVSHPLAGGEYAAPTRIFVPLVSRLRAGMAKLIRSYRNRRQAAELLSWDDRRLADIGITRTDVELAMGLPVSHDPSLQLQLWALERRAAQRAARREARGG